MKVPVTHWVESGFDASEVFPGVFVLDGLGAVLADSLGGRGMPVVRVDTSDVFEVSDDVYDDARLLRDGLLKRRKLL